MTSANFHNERSTTVGFFSFGTSCAASNSFDGESPKSCTMAGNLGAAARLGINVNNGSTAASRQCDTDHVCMLMPGNVTLPLVSGG